MRFIVLGEALIDLIQGPDDAPGVSGWSAHSGGSPLNSAVALANLGADVEFLGRLGEDTMGKQLRAHLESYGVGLEHAVRTTDPTTLAVVSLDEAGKASYAFHTIGTTSFNWSEGEFPELDRDDWLHFGSIGAVLEPSFAVVHRFLSKTPNRKSFDLNVRPSILPDRDEYVRKIESLLAIVGDSGGFAKASDEDLAWLTDFKGEPLETAQALCKRFRIPLFLVTLGADGAVAIGPKGELARVPGRKVEVADTVGAGDTFTAGFLSAWDGKDLEAALTRGIGASALVCTRHGAKPPTAEELDAFLA